MYNLNIDKKYIYDSLNDLSNYSFRTYLFNNKSLQLYLIIWYFRFSFELTTAFLQSRNLY